MQRTRSPGFPTSVPAVQPKRGDELCRAKERFSRRIESKAWLQRVSFVADQVSWTAGGSTSQLPNSLCPAMNYWAWISTVNNFHCLAQIVIILEPAKSDCSVEPGCICPKIFSVMLYFSIAMQKIEEAGISAFFIYIHIDIYIAYKYVCVLQMYSSRKYKKRQ